MPGGVTAAAVLGVTSFAVILALIPLLAGCAATTGPGDTAPRLIAARGIGRVAVKPDLAVVRVGAEMRAPTVDRRDRGRGPPLERRLDRVKALGVAERDITTVSTRSIPSRRPRRTEEDPSRIVAYRVVNMVQVKIRDLGGGGPHPRRRPDRGRQHDLRPSVHGRRSVARPRLKPGRWP